MIRRYGWAAVLVLIADRVTKALSAGIPEEGAALMLSGRPWLLGLLSLIIVAGAAVMLRKKHPRPLIQAGLMLMLGGALGNMIDRFWTGYVPDMIELLFVNFAIFNVADICLVAGCLMVMIGILREDGTGEKHGGSDL